MTYPALVIGGGILVVLAVVALFLHVRCAVRNHRTLVGIERDLGHLAHRRRMRERTARDKKARELVVRADRHPCGWVWIRVTHGEPMRGKRPEDCQHDRVEWAATRRGAERKRAKVLEAERGEITDVLLILLGLIVLSFILSNVGAKWTPGDVLDWFLGAAKDLFDRVLS